ncbi:ATP-dependent RNA helicase [Streptomyces jeddahensis]|uniref:ATP-dependent RNA helicase HrpB n=1 Tax=Streptomyces jeddahensis TaxID=1716141 RepID=A0A177HZJ3_9ACTN|nr:ATP-dependent helicase C-terminal domain-containing protein [Streptomyces jeddahensis]OAH16009.1 ATP-dependent RNA helicase HrpB [Streptomyces jeddahensis]
MIRTDALAQLPVRTAVPALREALEEHGTAVLCAPPGTGKTTLVPLALAGLLGDAPADARGPLRRVVVAEPRRIAARAAARRMAWLLGEQAGQRVGYTVRGERVVGRHARVEVVTTGVLLQRLQRDPELAGVDAVVIDECHERHLDADTVAAFLLDVRAALRPELRLLAASATTDAEGWARLLGGAPVVEAEGVSYPVEVVWAPPAQPVRPPHGMRVDPVLLTHVASVVRRALAERDGDVLCFLPGVGEIARVAGRLGDLGGVEVLQVHGRAPAAVQDAVLAGSPDGTRRVVLATSVAESSLTVPGVRVVVDSGLAREPRVDHARGLSALTTVWASQAAGRQRAGRAGREAPGAVYRCWSEAEDGRLPRFPAPEIRVADLASFALQAACWGDPDASGLALLDPPPGGAMGAAREVLHAIGAVDSAGRATERGTRMARLGLHPRLARALLDGAGEVGARRAAEVVALLSEEPPREYGDDLAAAWRAARRGRDAYGARWRAEARRLASAVGASGGGEADTGMVGPAGAAGPGPAADDAAHDDATHAVPANSGGTDGGHGDGGTPDRDRPYGGAARPGAAPGRGETATRAAAGAKPDSGNSGTEAAEPAGGAVPEGAMPAGAVPETAAPAAAVPSDGGDTADGHTGGGLGRGGAGRGSGARNGVGQPAPAADGGAACGGYTDDLAAGLIAALAFPERVARVRGEGAYRMVSGTGAELGEGSALRGTPWIAVAVADRPVGAGHARVQLGAVIDESTARRAAASLYDEAEEVGWADGDVVARRVERLGAVELAVSPLKDADSALVREALLDGLRREGLRLLRWTRDAEALRQRLAFLYRHRGAPWPDVSDDALHARVGEWLEPELSRARRRADLERIDAGQALTRLLPWASGEAARLDELAPERVEVPSGSRIRVDYGDPDQPVLAVKLQEMFGLAETPRVAGVPLLVHLLSPAGRPAAVTADLASFWRDGYRSVRAELRGRYPKHPWPEDPATAEPTRHTNARLRR